MANKYVSFHLGLNAYDPKVYKEAPDLLSAADDARAMFNVASALGYTALDQVPRGSWDGKLPRPPNVLINQDATYARAVELFRQSAALLQGEGDRCLITFSGHGAQLEEDTPPGAEEGKLNEAACLFDFPLFDDVICGLLGDFKKGVDVILVLDCCHSGATSADDAAILLTDKILPIVAPKKQPSPFGKAKQLKADELPSPADPPPPLPAELMAKFKAFDRSTLSANIAIFEACQDTEMTFDGKNSGELGIYTRKFVDAVGSGLSSVRAVAAAIAVAPPPIENCHPRFQHTKNDAFLSKPMKT